jgi:hypothetical protein
MHTESGESFGRRALFEHALRWQVREGGDPRYTASRLGLCWPVSLSRRHCGAGAPLLAALLAAGQYQRTLGACSRCETGRGSPASSLRQKRGVCVLSSAITSFSSTGGRVLAVPRELGVYWPSPASAVVALAGAPCGAGLVANATVCWPGRDVGHRGHPAEARPSASGVGHRAACGRCHSALAAAAGLPRPATATARASSRR